MKRRPALRGETLYELRTDELRRLAGGLYTRDCPVDSLKPACLTEGCPSFRCTPVITIDPS